jgi:hypothetical protein
MPQCVPTGVSVGWFSRKCYNPVRLCNFVNLKALNL